MTWKPIDGRGLTVAEFQKHVDGLNFRWPSGIALHNTGNPSLYPVPGDAKLPVKKRHGNWHGGGVEPKQRIQNLAAYYKGLGWSSGPHMFIDDELIWLFTPLTTTGTHSPSWNGTKIGIEMVGDYDVEEFNSGPGAKVRNNAVAALAILHKKLGIDPHTLKMHYEDTRTTHACPGKKVVKEDVIRRVLNYMGEAGDHDLHADIGATPVPTPTPSSPVSGKAGVVTAFDGLSLRELASASSTKKGTLPPETVVTILSQADNAGTLWYRVQTPAGYIGWVAGKYLSVGEPKKPPVTRAFIINTLVGLGWSEFAGYGAASNCFQESSFDPDAVGDKGTAYGLFQWHTDRQQAFKTIFKKDIQKSTAEEQLKFLDWELRNSEKQAGVALASAKTAYDAGAQFSRLFERPKRAADEAFNRGKRAQDWYDADHKGK